MVQRRTSVVCIALGTTVLVASSGPAAAQDKIVSVSALELATLHGQQSPRGGATTEAVRAARAATRSTSPIGPGSA